MKLYTVKVTHFAVVQAANEAAAVRTAEFEAYAIAEDLDPAIEIGWEITKVDDLPIGWHADDAPIGGDADHTIGEILEP